jgi:hypothetical protein
MMGKMLRGLRARAEGRGASGSGGGEIEAGRRPWVLHPFLIGAFPIVSLYAHNVYETSASAMARPMAVTLAGTFVAWMVLRLVFGDSTRAGLATSLLVATCFGFRPINRAADYLWFNLSWFWIIDISPVNPLTLLGVLAILIGAAFLVIFRWLPQPARWTRALNTFTFLLVALPAAGAMSARLGESGSERREAAPPTGSDRGWAPDIYFIMLDGYARSDVMKELFGFDNEPFLRRMEARGFFVARKSNSNYCQTRLSLASTLNANYLDKLLTPSTSDLLPITDLIRDNMVIRSLRPLNYKFVTFETGFEPTNLPDADVHLMPRPGHPGFTQLLLEMTPLDACLSEVVQVDRYKNLRDRTLYLLDHLPEVAGIPEPTFTFAHILGPHPPFVFGENGEDVSPRRVLPGGKVRFHRERPFSTPEYFREGYRQEAIFLTDRIERAIDQILADSPKPPIIVLQSDHGSWLRYHPDDLEATDLRERFGILNCIYVPNRKVEGLHDEMTSVNTFRAILKDVIGADLPPLEDRNYFSPFHDPLEFTDVTRRLHSPEERTRTFRYPPDYFGVDQQF